MKALVAVSALGLLLRLISACSTIPVEQHAQVCNGLDSDSDELIAEFILFAIIYGYIYHANRQSLDPSERTDDLPGPGAGNSLKQEAGLKGVGPLQGESI